MSRQSLRAHQKSFDAARAADDERAAAEARLHVLGDLLVRGWATERDLEAVRAMPAAFLRVHSSSQHFALFVAVRQGTA